MSSRNEETSSRKERRRTTNRVQLEENVFTTQISHYHQTMGYYSGVGPPFMPDRNCYNNINWSSRAPPWTSWTPPPPGAWMTSSVSNGAMVPSATSFPCRVPNRVPPSPFNPPTMPTQHAPLMDPLLASMHNHGSNNIRGWYARYPNDIPVQEMPIVVPSGRLDNIECLRHVGNPLQAEQNFVEKTLVQKCETTASTVTRRSWYKMPEKNPPQSSKEKTMKTSDKIENSDVDQSVVLSSKAKKIDDAMILAPDYCSKLSTADPSSKTSNCLPEVPNHDASSNNFTEYFLKRLMKKHQKESNLKKISVPNSMIPNTQAAHIQAACALPEKRGISRVPIFKNHIPKSHTSKSSSRIIEDVIDLSRDSPPSTVSETNNNNNNNNNNKNLHRQQKEAAAACDLVITNSYSLSFSGGSNKAANPSSLIGARPTPSKRKLPEIKTLTLKDNQKENLILSESMRDIQIQTKSKRKKYEPRKRDNFPLEDDAWMSGTMNKLIASNFHSNDKNILTPNIVEKSIPSVQSNKYLNKNDTGNAPEYCDIVDILHSLSGSGPNSQGLHASSKDSVLPKKDSVLDRKIIQTTNSIDKCITLDDSDESDGTQSVETLTPCTVIRSRQSLDTLSTADDSVDSLHDSTISSSSFDHIDEENAEEEDISEKEIKFPFMTEKNNLQRRDNHDFTASKNALTVLKENISLAKKKVEGEEKCSLKMDTNTDTTKSTCRELSIIKAPVCELPKATLPIKNQPLKNGISDVELETLKCLGQKESGGNVAVVDLGSDPKEEDYSPNNDGSENNVIILPDPNTSVVSKKTPPGNSTPIRIRNSSENPKAIIVDGLENSERTSFIGNESDDSLPSIDSISDSPLPLGIDTIENDDEKMATDAAKARSINKDDGNTNLAKSKQIFDPVLTDNSLAEEPGLEVRSDDLDSKSIHRDENPCNATNDKDVMKSCVVDSLESQKQQRKQMVSSQLPEKDSSFKNAVLHLQQVRKQLNLSSSSNNIFTLTTSPLKSKTTNLQTDCDKAVPTTILQQPRLEIMNLSKKVSSCNNSKEIDQTPYMEISENGDMQVIAIVTDYEESACDSLLGFAEPQNTLGKNPNVIITSIDSSKKDAEPEYPKRINGSPFKSKVLSLTENQNCKNPKENGYLYPSLLKCHKEKDLFSKNTNGDIIVLNDPTPKRKQHCNIFPHQVESSVIRDKVSNFATNPTIGVNIISVELEKPSPFDSSADKSVEPLGTLVKKCTKELNCVPKMNDCSSEMKEKIRKFSKTEKINCAKHQIAIKVRNYLNKWKRLKISKKKHYSNNMYRQFKKKYLSLGIKTNAVEFQKSSASCIQNDKIEPSIDKSIDSKAPSSLAPVVFSRIPLAKYDLNILRDRISSACPIRRGHIFHPPQSAPIKDKTADSTALLNKQSQTDNPFYGCLTHAFKGSCYQQIERRNHSPMIIHKFVKFHGHKLLCVIINVKKYIIVRELVQKCFQGRNQIQFYRTKYRDYGFPYLELPLHMKSFALKYLLESGSLLVGNKATPMGIMLLSDAEIIYHFFYSFQECNLTACVQDWDADDCSVYDCNWLEVLDTEQTESMKSESIDTVTDTGLSRNNTCTCNHTSNGLDSASEPYRAVARKPMKRPMLGIFEPSFESPIFGTTSSSTQTSPLDTNFSTLPDAADDVATKIMKRTDSNDTIEYSYSNDSLEESLVDSDSQGSLSSSDTLSISSDHCDYLSEPISGDFVFETHRNDNDNDNRHGTAPLQTEPHFSHGLPKEDQSKINSHETPSPLSDSTSTPEFVLGGVTLLEGKVVRFVEMNGQRHYLLTDIDRSWTLTAILDRLLESEIVVLSCSPSQRSFLLNLNHTLPQTNVDDMLLISNGVYPRLKICLSQPSFDSPCPSPPMVYSKPDTELSTPEQQKRCLNESQSERNYLLAETNR